MRRDRDSQQDYSSRCREYSSSQEYSNPTETRTFHRFDRLLGERIGRVFEWRDAWWRITSSHVIEECGGRREAVRWPDVVNDALETSIHAVNALETLIEQIPPVVEEEEKLMTLEQFATSDDANRLTERQKQWLTKLLKRREAVRRAEKAKDSNRKSPPSSGKQATPPSASPSTRSTTGAAGGTWSRAGEAIDDCLSSAKPASESPGSSKFTSL
jgi:hypothetical protein